MKEQKQLWRNRKSDPLRICLFLLLILLGGQSYKAYSNWNPPSRYESESGYNTNVSVSSANSGYSGSGYVTGLVTASSETKFDRGTNSLTLIKIDIRYANGTASNITNLAFYVGSQKIQDLVLTPTGSWSTWATKTLTFSHDPSWGGNMIIKSTTNVTTSANIDFVDYYYDDGQGTPSAVAPSFSPAGGTYTSTQSVTLSTSSSGATIYYTTDGSTPTISSAIYSSAISVASTKTIKAFTQATGMLNSSVASATYTINTPSVATPTFSPAAGTYSSTQSVTISTSTSGATIYYTTDGSAPTTSSAVYSAAISVASTKTIKALATKSGMTNSQVGSAAYTITVPTVATPSFSPAGGTYTSTQSVSISTSTSNATIYYTTDGTAPTTASAVYSAAISVAATKTIKALATTSGMADSQIGSATYTITVPPPAPGAFTQTAPAGGATGVSRTPAFTWASASNAASYTLVVSTNSSLTSPAINKTGITGTSYTPSAQLAASTVYYWSVTAVNSTASTTATNSGLSFTTAAGTPPPPSQAGVIREVWSNVDGTSISSLTSNANYPNSPTTSTVISTIDPPRDLFDSYGQRIKGYLAPTVTGSYKFWIASDDDSELWLSTTSDPSNKVKIASFTGWAYPETYDQSASQASANISLTAGNYYYIEALHKEGNGGDHVTVAWQVPGGSRVTIPNSNLVTAPPVPIPAPGAFNQSAPAGGATGVALNPTLTWGASSDAASYTVVVANNSSFTSPVVNQTGVTATSYSIGGGLSGTTTYYWKVTAVNASGTRAASNAGLSFTTLTPPAPSAFTQTAPASGATNVSTYPSFSWAAATNASSYALIVSTSSSYASPIINQSGLTSTSYTGPNPFATNVVYYWKVTATNSTGSTVATNAGISFTTGTTSGTVYYVTTSGSNSSGDGSSGNPWRTLAYAASQITPGTGNKTISLGAGTFVETAQTYLPLGVNIVGAGESNTIITANGAFPIPSDVADYLYPLYADGSLIQLKSPIYINNARYGPPSEMVGPTNGSQSLSGFTMDGHSKTVKAGVWVENRSNVTMHHVTFRNFAQSGSVFSRGDMWWYVALPDGKWMLNTSIHDCTFINSGSTPGEQVGNLCLGGLDGADIYNITITDNVGEGIKFSHVGHFRNTKIHDCTVTVGENDALWNEKIAIELWNMSYGNELYNFNCNTWLSLVNHGQFSDYQPTAAHPSNLKVHNVRIIDQDGTSSVEAIECALSGVEIYDSYIQDKGFGVAIWGGSAWAGNIDNHDVNIHNNIFTNVNRGIQYGFGNSSAVFVPDAANNIKVHNNVFDKMGNALQLDKASNVSIKNNVFQNCGGDDVQNGSGLTFTNNLRYNNDSQRPNWQVSTSVNSTNIQGNPGFKNSGSRWTTYYQPASASSLVVDKGVNVGLPANGNPDIGRWEFGLTSFRSATEVVEETSNDDMISSYPNPTTGKINITSTPGVKISAVQVLTLQGKSIMTKSANKFNNVDLDLSEYPSDIYILKVKHQNGLAIRKIALVK